MSGILIDIVAVAVILGFMILIHEFGHFAVAKLLGVRVEQFAIGFGTRLIGFKKGETDYRINLLPLGGYVKMSGENPMDERTGDPREFLSHSRWHRFLIAIAGPFMNIVLAIGLLTIVYMVHYEHATYMDQPTVIGWVEQDSAAAKIGLQRDDVITQLEGIQDPTWQQLITKVMLSPNQPLNLTVRHDGQTSQKTLVPEAIGPSEMGFGGLEPKHILEVTDLEPGMPAEKAGLKIGDVMVALNGKPLLAVGQMIDILRQTKDQPVTLTVSRDGQMKDFTLKPVLNDMSGSDEPRYRVGIGSVPTKVIPLSFPEALSHSFDTNEKTSVLILELVEKLVQRKVSMRAVSGPIGIAQAAGEAAQEKGWTPLMELTAAISLNLGIFNLLPIPILDGGIILFLFIEGLMRRDISMVIKERVYQAAFVFLVLFAVMVIYNDIRKTGMLP
ncbi:MAG TPA: RIP metalloprotease RseP [Terriglobales bacterium]|jgi:regulator of sigma E protease